MKLRDFIASKIFLKQVAIAFVLTFCILYITTWGLKIYTHHGQKISVPDFRGMTLEETEKVITENQLRYMVMDSAFRPNIAPGTILYQRPVAGFEVKQNRTIFLTINAHNPEKVRFPELINTSFRQAIAILESNGFKIGHLEYVESDFRNLVIEQKHKGDTILSGDLITKGATIDLVLGTGKNPAPILIPTLIGMDQSQAKETILFSNLNIGEIKFDKSLSSSLDLSQAKVWKQQPTFGENIKVNPGSRVDIWMTVDSTKISEADSLVMEKLEKSNY